MRTIPGVREGGRGRGREGRREGERESERASERARDKERECVCERMTDEDNAVCLGVVEEELDSITMVGAVEGVSADADAC
jgi:hypothetical protein